MYIQYTDHGHYKTWKCERYPAYTLLLDVPNTYDHQFYVFIWTKRLTETTTVLYFPRPAHPTLLLRRLEAFK